MNPSSKSSTFKLTAAAGKWTGARLGGLPKNGTLSVKLAMTGQVTICLLDARGYESLPEVRSPILTAQTANDYAFSVVVPESGDYFLVADNRFGSATQHIDATVTVSASSPSVDRSDVLNIAQALLQVVEKAMHLVFCFDAEPPSTALQDAIGAEPPRRINLDPEFCSAVFNSVGDQETSSNILLFSLFYEVANQLAHIQRGQDDWTSDEIDDLAAALLVMFGYSERARIQAEFLAEHDAHRSVAMTLGTPDHRVLDADRARGIIERVDDPRLLDRWAEFFLQRMQTPVLERFVDEPPAWTTSQQALQTLSDREHE